MGGVKASAGRALATALLILASTVAAGASPAAADEPTVVVSPVEVVDGQQVGVDISGFPSGYSGLVQCSGSVLDLGTPWSLCMVHEDVAFDGLPPSHAELRVRASFPTYGEEGERIVDCRTEPSGCVVGVVTVSDRDDLTSVIAEAYEPITFLPELRGSPNRGLSDGATVTVEGAYVPAGTWSIAQCGRAVLDHPTRHQVRASCGEATPVTVAGDGTFTAELTVHDPLTSRSGATVPCGRGGCAVVLSSPDDPVVQSFGIAFGAVTLEVDPATDITEGALVLVTVTGAPDGTSLYQCALPVDADLPDSRCSSIQPLFLDAQGNYRAGLGLIRPVIGTPAGERIDCRVEACALTLFSESGARLVEPVPISFAPPPSATLQPSEGLLDGQDMTLVIENVQPGHPYYTLGRCIDYYTCQSLGPLTVGPDGRIEVTVPAAQQFTPDFSTHAPVYCRANCLLIVRSPLAIGFFVPYAMAEGELAVAPATGLSDGQEVQVTGRELMSTYDGVPAGPYATGGWALTQCDRAVLDQPDLLGVFTHCSVPPPTRGVTIEGSTLDTTFEVQATITKLLGGTTDCIATPDACVVGLVRLEQDLSISTHLVPISFT